MPLSSFALIVGVYCYVFGFPMVFMDEKHIQWRQRMLKDENMLRLLGTAFIMISVTTLRHHWKVTADAEGIVILVAWLTFIKSLVIAWWPRQFSRIATRIEASVSEASSAQVFLGFIMVLFGAFFTFLGLVLI